MPVLVKDFTILLPAMLINYTYEGKVLKAIGIFAFFGLAVGSILGLTRGVWNWGYRSALGAWAILFLSTLAGFIIRIIKDRRAAAASSS
jgi:hypothetical protein